ncbi:hypothetical protein SFUMM280S_11068 [Streptomyces fumanus]
MCWTCRPRPGTRPSGGFRRGFPVALRGDRMLLLVAAGGAEELPGLLEWLEWGSLELGLRAVGAGGRIDAPLPAGPGHRRCRAVRQGAAVWLRPPEPGRGAGASLPTLSAMVHSASPPVVRPASGHGGDGAPTVSRAAAGVRASGSASWAPVARGGPGEPARRSAVGLLLRLADGGRTPAAVVSTS